MSIKSATPYLILNGKADQAIALYQRALGAHVESLQRFGDMDASCPAATRARVMHAVLQVGHGIVMISDSDRDVPVHGDNVNVALDFEEPEEARRCFDALAASGKVEAPLADAPWGALFGALKDEFGINWMFHCATKAP